MRFEATSKESRALRSSRLSDGPGGRRRRIVVLSASLLLVAAAMPAFGCRGCRSRSYAPTPGRFVVQLEAEPPHLNPIIQEDMWLKRIVTNTVFETLVRRNPSTGEFEPNLAVSWKMSPDAKSLTLELRRSVSFHDGRPFSAADLLFTLDKVMDPTVTAAAARAGLDGLSSWKKTGPGRVRLIFDKPSPRVLEALAHLCILPRHIYGVGDFNHHPAADRPVGTGPFRFQSWRHGEYIRLVRNRHYWGRRPGLDEIVFRVVRSRTKALAMLRAGRLDLLSRVPPCEVFTRKGRRKTGFSHGIAVRVFYPVQFYSIVLNHKNPLFGDRRVRRALAMLLDRAQIAEKLYCGQAKVVSGPYWIGGSGYDPTVKPWPYDPGKAAKLLEQAGWKDRDGDGLLDRDGKPFRFQYFRIMESTLQRRFVPVLRESFRKAGLDMQVVTLPWAQVLARLRAHQFDMVDFNWGSDADQDLFQLFHSSQCRGGSNYGCYANPAADRLLEKARTTADVHERHAIERKLHRLFHDDLPVLFLFDPAAVSLVRSGFQGVEPTVEWFQLDKIRPGRSR